MFFARSPLPWWAAPALAAVLLVGAGCSARSRFQGMQAVELHALAQQEFDRGDHDDAIETLDRIVLVYPDYPQIAEVRFLLARAYQEDQQYLLASDEYLRFLERHGGHPLAGEAAAGVCRSYVALSPIPARDQTYTRQAYNVCRDVAREYATHAVAEEASALAQEMRSKLAEKEYASGRHYYDRDAFDSAIIVWEALLIEYPDTPWGARALAGIYCSWLEIGYEDDAEDARLRLQNLYPDSDEARQARDGGLSC
jgi:outer membrane protein assembly factor BamD